MRAEWVRLLEGRSHALRFDFPLLQPDCGSSGLCIASVMSVMQDSAFCVPVYGQAESASAAEYHTHITHSEEARPEAVPVFDPHWRDKPQAGQSQQKEQNALCDAGRANNSLSTACDTDKRLASSDQSSADVSTATVQETASMLHMAAFDPVLGKGRDPL